MVGWDHLLDNNLYILQDSTEKIVYLTTTLIKAPTLEGMTILTLSLLRHKWKIIVQEWSHEGLLR